MTDRIDNLIKKAIDDFGGYVITRLDFTAEPVITWAVIDNEYEPIAGTGGSHINFNRFYMKDRSDIDIIGIVVHEMVHVFQAVPMEDYIPNWWEVEGIADLIRMECTKEVWDDDETPRLGYKHAANFFKWLETNHFVDIIKPISVALRDGTYDEDIFEIETGVSLDTYIAGYLSPVVLPVEDHNLSIIDMIINFFKWVFRR
tara:strand:- start:2915 stop:3517 length:603 start_codon:yes stop_codon:yes gene_type:complete